MSKDQSTSWLGEHPVNHSALQDCDSELAIHAGTLRSPICEWLINCDQDGASGRMSPVYCHPMADETLVPSSGRWKSSGIAAHGECWTHKISESPRDAEESTLSDVLQEIGTIQPQYYSSVQNAVTYFLNNKPEEINCRVSRPLGVESLWSDYLTSYSMESESEN